MGTHELSALVWRERELLETLVFKLEVEQLLLAAGKNRWIAHATRDVELVLGELRAAGLARTVEVAALAEPWGMADDASLREVVAHAPEPWREIFSDHLTALMALTDEITRLRDTNEQFLRAAARSTQETLARIDVDAGTYDSRGATTPPADGAHFVQKDL